jgi:hypothetical protein
LEKVNKRRIQKQVYGDVNDKLIRFKKCKYQKRYIIIGKIDTYINSTQSTYVVVNGRSVLTKYKECRKTEKMGLGKD